jgi:two-component sensor histidine kinase
MGDSGVLSLRSRPGVATLVALGSVASAAILIRLAMHDYGAASRLFHPHGYCYLWIPSLVATHVVTDSLIGLSYVAISLTLVWLVWKARRGLPFSWIFIAFGVFIVACGATHFMEIWTLWQPVFWLAADVKIVTAGASVLTALVLPPLVPKVLGIIQAVRVSEERGVELERTQDKMRESLREKEVLLKEVHHRVKNNLQVISSLLNLQARHLSEPGARRIFAESQNRVQAIALVHEKLYQSSDLSQIQFDEYVQTLVSNLCHSLDAAERDISPSVEAGGIRVAVDVAIPCGLIINELVTNSLEHAFPDRRGGSIQVLMRRDGSGRLELVVHDDGVGLPAGLDPHQTPSLGLDLVFTFAEQLGATVDVRRHPGTAFSFVFPQNG